MSGEIIDSKNQSSSENLRKFSWVEEQTQQALNNLGSDTEKVFYEEDSEKRVVTYKMEVVKQYLTSLYDKVKNITSIKEAWNKLVEEGNTSAWIMAVQIALESLGNPAYDVGRIDGIFKKGGTTEAAVKNFQRDNGLTPDGAPGKETIRVLLEKIGEHSENQGEEKDELKDVKVKEGEQELPAGEVKAENLVEVPEGEDVKVEYDGTGVNKDKKEQEVTVIVKVGDKVKKVVVIVEINDGKMKVEAQKDEFENVKVREGERDLPEEKEVEAKDLLDGVPEGEDVKVDYDEKGVDKTITGPQTVTVVVKKGDEEKRRITVIVTVDAENKKYKVEAEEKKEDKETLPDNEYGKFEWKYLDGVENCSKVAIGSVQELKDFLKISDSEESAFTTKKTELLEKYNEEYFKIKDLSFMYFKIPNTASPRYEIKSVEKAGNQINAVYGNDGVDRGTIGSEVITSEVLFVETNKGETVNWIEEGQESVEVDEFENIKVREGERDLPEEKEVEAKDLLDGVPEGEDVKVDYDEKGVDKTITDPQTLTVVVKKGDEEKRRITVIVTVDAENKKYKVEAEEKKEEEVDEFENIKVKEGERDLPEEKEVEAKDLLDGVPEGEDVKVEYGEKGVDKTSTDPQTVTVVVKKGDEEKRRITVIVTVDVENKKYKVEDKEKKEAEEELNWLNELRIEDLGSWDKDGNYVFKVGLIDEETEKLTVKDKEIEKLGESGSGFGYLVEDGKLLIGNFENGLLNGNGIEFSSRADEYRNLLGDQKPENSYGLKICGKWEKGLIKDGVQTFREDGVDVHIKVEEGETTKCYLDEESKVFDLEKVGDSWYLKDGENSLKLKNLYSIAVILKIFHDYKDEEGEFYVNTLGEGLTTKKLSRKSSTGETSVVYWYADNLVESLIGSGASALAFWLNEARKPVEDADEHKVEEAWVEKFNLDDIGGFENGSFVFKAGVENPDGDGKTYIEVGGEKFYKDNENGLSYVMEGDFCIGKSENGNRVGPWIECEYLGGEIWKGEYNSDGKKHGEWKVINADGKQGGGKYENGDEVGPWVEYSYYNDIHGMKREGEYNSEGKRHGEWKTTTAEGKQGGGKYENGEKVGQWVEYDDGEERKGEYNNEGNRHGNWEITTKDGKKGGGKYENGEKVGQWVEFYGGEEREGEYNSEGKRHGEWKTTTAEGKQEGGKFENGKKVGQWVEFYDGEERKGEYNNEGNRHGNWEITTKDGKKGGGKYENGEKVGQWVEFYGGEERKGEYNNEGNENGNWEITTEDGKKGGGKFENGKKVGQWVEFYDGEERKGEYNNEGNRHGNWEITTKDGKKGGGKYENGKQVGQWVEFYGGDRREGDYNSDGKMEGEWKVTKEDGTVETKKYNNGNEISE